jgi:hypothetical protein
MAGLNCDYLPILLDLLYLEQRVGCWAAAQFYGHVGPRSFIVPFNQRRVIDALFHLPYDFRLNDRLAEVAIDATWPALLDLPFNEFTGLEATADRLLAPVRSFGQNHPRVRRLLGIRRGP